MSTNIRIVRDAALVLNEKLTNIIIDTETRRYYTTISEPYTIEILSKALKFPNLFVTFLTLMISLFMQLFPRISSIFELLF